MPVTFQQVINLFVDGATEGYSGTKTNQGNLKIKGEQLIHYNTPIAERYGDMFILNTTRYSLQTGQLQKKIKATIPEEKRIDVKRVPSDTTVSLKDYIE
ncbi:Uncharacterised protein [uncultured Ruminococcus sp.]|nr:hypothetical protein [uncultured Ruminococcus sp.]SCJ65748.1 Uncharacterised protein [uncultured Ruminococcus sp.]